MPHIPDQTTEPAALARTTHLGIGAHQDDLEFMAFHGILACYENTKNWFTGVTCTNGSGSSRIGPFATFTDEEMIQVRHEEQNAAADLGQYAAQFQLGHPSSTVKDPHNKNLTGELAEIIRTTQPHTIYTHQPADKHPSHLGTLQHTLAALRSLPPELHPSTFIGCEVWRDLDWLPDEKKVVMDVSARPELAEKINNLFQSQIAGGKNYHHAIIGRRTANATFSNPHSTDAASQIIFGLDLLPLLKYPELSLQQFTIDLIDHFKIEIYAALRSVTS